MNRVFVLAPGEDWIVDRFVKEWNEDNSDICVSDPAQADVIWLLSDWTWRRIPHSLLQQKKVITTIHHIVAEKFDVTAQADFVARDVVTTAYHVYNQRTFDFIRQLTDKPIFFIKYWSNHLIWRRTGSKVELRKKFGLPIDSFICGSFQRDTEGLGISRGIFLPKMEKGPDLLVDFLEKIWETQRNLHIVLAGWRRQYVMEGLDRAKIPYSYFERPKQEIVNELYQCLDLYPITAREEGGPQALIEAGLLGVSVVSRPVGIAEQVLPFESINDDVSLAVSNIPNVESWKIPAGYQPYRDLIQSL